MRLKVRAERAGNFDQAIADYTEAIRLDPTAESSYQDRAFAWARLKNWRKAIQDYDQALRIDPRDADILRDRGLAHSYTKEYGKAIADYAEAIRLAPKHSQAHNSLAWLCATCPDGKLRDGKRAVESAKKACELTDWNDAFFLGTLAAACAEAGDFAAAVNWQINANELYDAVEDREKGLARLTLYQDRKPYREVE